MSRHRFEPDRASPLDFGLVQLYAPASYQRIVSDMQQQQQHASDSSMKKQWLVLSVGLSMLPLTRSISS